jgi:hypothetical protein
MCVAHFTGSTRGSSKSAASRSGTKASGLRSVAASWQGAVEVVLRYDAEKGVDMACVRLIPWNGEGSTVTLYDGPVSGLPLPQAVLNAA